MKLLFIILIILLILFIPIPFKLIIYFSKENYYVKFYKLTLISKRKLAKKKYKEKVMKKIEVHKNFISKNKNQALSILKSLKLTFKPDLRIKGTLDYSLNDAAKTAIFYGALCELLDLIHSTIDLRFKLREYDFHIEPIFKDELLLKIEISSIIFLSITHIIYILVIVLRSIIKFREVNP